MKRLFLVAFAFSVAIWAQGPGGPGGPHGGFGPGGPGGMVGPGAMGGMGGGTAHSPDALKEFLVLTDGQVTQLQELRKKQFESMKPIAEQIRAKSQELRTALDAANPDQARVGQLTVEIKQLREQMKASRTGQQDQALAVLTPEQKTKLKQLEDALKLMPAARQGVGLGLLDAPEPAHGRGLIGRAVRMHGLRARASTRV